MATMVSYGMEHLVHKKGGWKEWENKQRKRPARIVCGIFDLA